MTFLKNIILQTRKSISSSLFFTALISLIVNPLLAENNSFNSFNRVFGNATMSGIDANSRIINFTLFNILFIPLCYLLVSSIIYWLTKDYDKNNKYADDTFAFLGKH